jgi:hypothetical protein
MKNNKFSVEDAIRQVQQRYKNRPSPLANLNENNRQPVVPQQGFQQQDFRNNLLGNFRPNKDTYR